MTSGVDLPSIRARSLWPRSRRPGPAPERCARRRRLSSPVHPPAPAGRRRAAPLRPPPPAPRAAGRRACPSASRPGAGGGRESRASAPRRRARQCRPAARSIPPAARDLHDGDLPGRPGGLVGLVQHLDGGAEGAVEPEGHRRRGDVVLDGPGDAHRVEALAVELLEDPEAGDTHGGDERVDVRRLSLFSISSDRSTSAPPGAGEWNGSTAGAWPRTPPVAGSRLSTRSGLRATSPPSG